MKIDRQKYIHGQKIDRQLERKCDYFSAEGQRLDLKCECIEQYTSDRQIDKYMDINLRTQVDKQKTNLSGQMDRFEQIDEEN